jgi:hypothetical protein
MKLWAQRILYRICVTCRPHNSRTVRIAFPLLLVSLVFLGASTISSTNSSYIILETAATALQEGEAFTLDVYVFAHQPVNAIDITLAYPKDQLLVRNVSTGQSVITLWTREPYVENNTVFLQGGTYRQGFSGKHFIARINGVALQSGVADIVAKNVKLLAGDGSGTEIKTEDGEASVRVRVANENGEIMGQVEVVKIITDIDGDGKVSMADILRFMEAWFARDAVYDFNGDGRMTIRDFSIILAESFSR